MKLAAEHLHRHHRSSMLSAQRQLGRILGDTFYCLGSREPTKKSHTHPVSCDVPGSFLQRRRSAGRALRLVRDGTDPPARDRRILEDAANRMKSFDEVRSKGVSVPARPAGAARSVLQPHSSRRRQDALAVSERRASRAGPPASRGRPAVPQAGGCVLAGLRAVVRRPTGSA